MKKITINASPEGKPLHYKELNKKVRERIADGYNHIVLENVAGHRFIGAGITQDVTIDVFGDAGLNVGVFAQNAKITVHGCAEYLTGNTLNGGEIVVYGDSWDITGMGARAGNIFIMGEGGSRVGIHMKQFKDKSPAIVYGGRVKQYCGEYMAGGTIIILGLDYTNAIKNPEKPVSKENIEPSKIKEHTGNIVQPYLGSGIHGGAIYIRGEIPQGVLGTYAVKEEFTPEDKEKIAPLLERFSDLFNTPMELIESKGFSKVVPVSKRPFESIYTKTPI